ncbi:MAG: type II toxin-antitoxin system RelE/ParE family toxin [Terracidiphilus sp.]
MGRYGSKCYTLVVVATAPSTLRVFASKPFMRFARSFGIDDEALRQTVNGAFDADLGGGVFKYRLARQGEGASGGARALIALNVGRRAVLMFGFEKKDMANIRPDELRAFRKAAKIYLGYSEDEISAIVKQKALIEIGP